MLINRASLSQTVDAINAAHFDGRTLTADERGHAARWIAARHALPGAYGGTFAGFPSERSRGIVLFTGERITSASARHILGEEASRALRQLRVRDPNVTRALDSADSGLMRCLERAAAQYQSWSFLLRQVQRGLVAELARRRPRSTRRATSTWCVAFAIDARRRTSMAQIPLLVHGARPQRDGQRRSEGGVEACGARPGTRGEPCCTVSSLWTTPIRVGRSNAGRSLVGGSGSDVSEGPRNYCARRQK